MKRDKEIVPFLLDRLACYSVSPVGTIVSHIYKKSVQPESH